MSAPVVFVSYSHDSQEHKQWVLDLATRLRGNGIDAILDQWDLGPGGDLPHFMEQSLARAARVLMICTARYVEKADLGRGGVGYEKMIVTADLIKQIGSNRVIPIIRQAGTIVVPRFLGSKLYIDLSSEDQFETGMDQLLRELLGAPLFEKPALGSAPVLSTTAPAKRTNPDPVTQFVGALSRVYGGSSNNGAIKTELIRSAMGTSKLFFDHALDLAVVRGLVVVGSSRDTVWVQGPGRLAMLQVQSGSQGAP